MVALKQLDRDNRNQEDEKEDDLVTVASRLGEKG